MEFRDLKTQYYKYRETIDLAMQQVIDQTAFISGRQVRELEQQLENYTGVRHCISCANGTDALQLALMAWNIGLGDAVFVPDFTFFSSGEVVPLVGATPIFVDVEKDTFNMSSISLQEAVEKVLKTTNLHPKAVIAVDLFGQPANYEEIRKIVKQFGLRLIEDGAQGFGGQINEKKACSFGDISTTSFFPAKPLGCYGDGGAIFTNDDEEAQILRSLRVHGKGIDKYDNVRIGMNSRLDTLQAAILCEKMKFLDEEIGACQVVADEYTKRLQSYVKTPVVTIGMKSAWAQYTIQLASKEQRDTVTQALKQESIPSAIYYVKPMHLQKAFWGLLPDGFACPVTEQICATCLSLPMHAYLSVEEIEMICETIKKAL